MRSAINLALPGGTSRSDSPWITSVGAAIPEEAAVRLPGKNSLQLGCVCFGLRKPWPANRQVFINPFTRSRRIVDKRHGRFGGLLRAHFLPPHQHLDRFRFGAHRGRPARRGAAQNQRPHSLRVLQRELLRNHATHGDAEYMRTLNAGGIQNRRGIGRHQRDGIRSRRHIALPYATVVEREGPVVRRQKQAVCDTTYGMGKPVP